MERNHKKDVAFNNMLNNVLDGGAHSSELAQELANRLAGTCYSLGEIRADSLYETVRREMGR